MCKKSLWCKTLTILLLVVVATHGVAIWFFSNQIIAFDVNKFPSPKENEVSIRQAGLPPPETVTFGDKRRPLSGWYFENPAPRDCAALILHGHRTHKETMLQYASLFFRKGCHTFLPDHRHHGESYDALFTWGNAEEEEVGQAYRWLKSRSQYLDKNLAVMGASLGGALALQTVGHGLIQPAFVVADSSYSDMATIVKERGTFLFGPIVPYFSNMALAFSGIRAHFSPEDNSPEEAARRITLPVLLIHSRQDEFTQWEHSQRIFDALPPGKKQIVITDWNAAHTHSLRTNPGQYQKFVEEFVQKNVPKFPWRSESP